MTMLTTNFLFSLLLVVLAHSASICPAFVSPQGRSVSNSKSKNSSPLFMAPKWDGSKWVPTSPEEGPEAGYGIGKTLLLHGPKPFFNRVFQPNDYEQAVLKFMAQDKCNRIEAQGNMDFYLSNPNDWAFNRMEMEKRGMKYDYTTLNTKQIILTLTWASAVLVGGPWYFQKVFGNFLPF